MDRNIIEKMNLYFRRQPIEKVWLFGSFSRGEENNESDVDLLVEFSKSVKIGMNYFKIIDDLEAISQRKIDLAESHMLDSRIADRVNNEKILIYERAR